MKTFVTISGDSGLWIWNASNKEVKGQVDGFIGTTVRYYKTYYYSLFIIIVNISKAHNFTIKIAIKGAVHK
jgi:hypothetical protein